MSIDLWRKQLFDFSRDVMGVDENKRVYIMGNSLGGLLAVQIAALHPESVQGLVLLNATPFWSFRPSLSSSQGVWGLAPSGFGSIPVPKVRVITACYSHCHPVLRLNP